MRLLLIFFALLIAMPCQAIESDAESKLLKVVVISRHGVRAPTQGKKALELWSQKPWPVWPVEKGDLTPRGSHLVTAMWSNIGLRLAKMGLLPENTCPPQSAIFVRADVDERTRATAAALLAGFGPNCNLGYAVLQGVKVDPLFHPVKAGLFHFNPVSAATDILSNTSGGLDNLQDEYSTIINLIGSISGEPAPQLCERFAMVSDCSISDLPNAISVSPDGSNIKLAGSLDIASSMAEIFLLEYAQWPGQDAGWGQVNGRLLEQIMPVHAKIFDVVNRAPLIAWAKGSSLLQEISQALSNTHPDKRCNDARLVVFVGHDTNIANIGALLDLNWQAETFPHNGIPPAGALFFELWDINGKKQIRIHFFAQTVNILHQKFNGSSFAAYAPKQVPVSSPPVVGEVRITPEQLATRVKDATEGAPIAPVVMPPLSYSKTFNPLNQKLN